MEAEARDRFWHEVERIATGILILPGEGACQSLPVSGICDPRSSTISFTGSGAAAVDLDLHEGCHVWVTFADPAECVFVSLQAAVSAVDRSTGNTPARLRPATSICDVGSGIVVDVKPVCAQMWERPGRGFLDALDLLTHGADEARALADPRTITF